MQDKQEYDTDGDGVIDPKEWIRGSTGKDNAGDVVHGNDGAAWAGSMLLSKRALVTIAIALTVVGGVWSSILSLIDLVNAVDR